MSHQFWVIAGPNGAGKSTLTERYLAKRLPIVNPDNIVKQISGVSNFEAGRIALQTRKKYLAACKSFGWETTLSGHRELAFIEQAKAAGYKINLVYIGVNNPQLSLVRISERVDAGGHHVLADDAIRRYLRSLRNLRQAMIFANRSYILDNSNEHPTLVYSEENQKEKRVAKNLPKWVKQALGKNEILSSCLTEK